MRLFVKILWALVYYWYDLMIMADLFTVEEVILCMYEYAILEVCEWLLRIDAKLVVGWRDHWTVAN